MKNTIAFFLLLMVSCAQGQDTQYSQFYGNPLYLNPAFAGTASNTRISLNHRILWPNLPQAYASYALAMDYHAGSVNSGFGAIFNTDTEGSASLQTNLAALVYAYEVNVNNKFVFRPALQFGYVFRSIDPSNLILGDQVDFGLDGAPTNDPSVSAIRLKDYWDIGTGFLAFTKRFWLGVSALHLTQPNTSILEGNDDLSMRISLHAGGRFPVGNSIWRGDVFPTIAPNILYKRQGNFQQLDAGASVHLQPVIFGLYYRGIPILVENFGQINQDALIVQVGLEYFGFEFGYSFDVNLSRLDPVSGGGAHEFSLQYIFKLPRNKRRVPRSTKKLPCPAFVERLAN